MKKRTFFQILSIILTITMFFSMFPAYADSGEGEGQKSQVKVEEETEPDEAQNLGEEATQPGIIGEIIEKRESNVKHFLKDDFTYEACVYPTDVHYKKDGVWEEIDNGLEETTDEDKNDSVENKSNIYKIKISKNSKSKKLVTIAQDGYEISWGLKDADKAEQSIIENITTNNYKEKVLSKLNSTIKFNNIMPGVTFEYQIGPNDVKENITLCEKTDNTEFVFPLNLKNLSAKLNDDNTITFYDEADDTKEVFMMEAPYMTDAANSVSKDIQVELVENDKNDLSIVYKPSKEWLDSSERVYPVIIDPWIKVGHATDDPDVMDSYVSSLNPGINYGSAGQLSVDEASNDVKRIYAKFALPELAAGDFVTESKLHLSVQESVVDQVYGSNIIDVHRVLSDWNENTITWNNKPDYDTSRIEEYATVAEYVYSQSQPYLDCNLDISGLVKDWYINGDNYGLMIKQHGSNANTVFLSNEADNQLYLSLNYTNNSGLESYWTYHSQDVNRAGTGYINDSNGNLVFIHEDINMNGNRMPLQLNHIYNSNDKAIDTGFGKGWRLNLSQTLVPMIIEGVQYYIYTDEDGTRHYIKYNDEQQKYIDESGINIVLTINSDNTYTITDKVGNKLNFSSSGILDTMEDNNGNTVTLGYDNNNLVSVTDGAGRITCLTYENGHLSSITDPSSRTTTYSYTGDKLTGITYSDTNTTVYDYDASSNLTLAQNYDGYKIEYTYYSGALQRLQKANEANTDGTLGEELSISYGNNATVFTDVNGRKNIYQFNNYGNTLSVVDPLGYAQYYQYLRGTNINNKLSLESKLQKSVLNLLKNHNAERNSDWLVDNTLDSTGSCSYSTDAQYMGDQSLKIEKTNTLGMHSYSQQLTLVKGKKYAFSGYVKTENISSVNYGGAAFFVTYKDSTGIWRTSTFKAASGTNDWKRYDFNFTMPLNASSQTAYVKVGINKESGTAYFDCLQYEEGSITNRYNMVENADFMYGSSFWTPYEDCDDSDTIVSLTDSDYPAALNNDCYLINGDAVKNKGIYQTVKVSGNIGDVFTLGGWAKGNPVPDRDSFTLELNFIGSTTGNVKIKFNDDNTAWQYLSGRIIAPNDYSEVEVNVAYANEANTCCFDGIQLYKEEFGHSFVYDSNGNVTSVVDLAGQNSQFEYNTTNDLVTSITPKGNNYIYNYDSLHNILDATTAENVVYCFTYDSYGNPLTAKTRDINNTMFIQSSSEYTSDGNYMSSMTNPLGDTAYYNYDQTKGTLDSVTDEKGNTTNNTYDDMDRLTDSYKSVNGQEVRNSFAYENDRLSTISHNDFNYTFDYDSLGNKTNISVENQNLLANTYEARTSKLLNTAYGNNQIISYDYDSLDRVVGKNYNGTRRFTYEYDADDLVGFKTNHVARIDYRYSYDMVGRLRKVADSRQNTTFMDYDADNNLSALKETLGTRNYNISYEYDDDSRLTKVTASNGSFTDYVYDIIGRLSNTTINTGNVQYSASYSYLDGINGSTTELLGTINNNGSQISYTYDANENIETITKDGLTTRYHYDELDELVREDIENTQTITYTYDAGGNLTQKTYYPYTTDTPQNPTGTDVYTYDSTWKDKLVSYKGNAITYDSIGNVTGYNGYTYTWEEGRNLKGISGNNTTIGYSYDDNGIRISKTVNGVTTSYHLVDDRVTEEYNGTDRMYYTYDSDDKLVSMSFNGTEYYYVRNGQGDIIGLIDGTGTQVVSYTYDTWGKLISIDGSLASTLGQKNPYRYRGYRYDNETGFYYLQSRYYNPEWGRFLSTDDIEIGGEKGELLTYNLYAYCLNNPVNNMDEDGYRPMPIVEGAVVSVAVNAIRALIATACVAIYFANKNTREDPYARPDQKKQDREKKEKKRGDDKKWRGNPNKRKIPTRPHTPSHKNNGGKRTKY